MTIQDNLRTIWSILAHKPHTEHELVAASGLTQVEVLEALRSLTRDRIVERHAGAYRMVKNG